MRDNDDILEESKFDEEELLEFDFEELSDDELDDDVSGISSAQDEPIDLVNIIETGKVPCEMDFEDKGPLPAGEAVEKPIELADFVLYSDPDWSGQRVQSTIYSGRTRTVHLPEPLPVYILYFTAWANPDGSISFHKDVYGLDSVLANALNSKTAYSDLATNIQ